MADQSKNTLYVSGGYTESPKASSSKVYKLEFANNKPIGDWLEAGSMKREFCRYSQNSNRNSFDMMSTRRPVQMKCTLLNILRNIPWSTRQLELN